MRAELWPLLCVALVRYARQARIHSRPSDEDLRDAMADKALDLLGRIETGRWQPAELTPGELCSFLMTVARNGVTDSRRRSMREVALSDVDIAWASAAASTPVVDFDALEHARAIVDCCSRMSPRARLVWFLRTMLELPSIEIAAHPGVRSTAPAVDSMLLRCRSQLSECLAERGFGARGFPAGTFTMLWASVLGSPRQEGSSLFEVEP